MRTNSEEQDASSSSKCAGRLACLSGVAVSSFLCIAGIALSTILVTFVVLHEECPRCPSFIADDSESVWIFTAVSTILLIFGGCIIVALVLRDHRLNSLNSSFSGEVVISVIPAEDLEKSPAPVLPYNHVPHRQMSTDLPDYFTAVQNIVGACSSVNVAANWTGSFPETPPPCYEQALEMIDIHKVDKVFVYDRFTDV